MLNLSWPGLASPWAEQAALQVVRCCADWEGAGFDVVFAMSNNSNMRWDISNEIGYEPVDDVSVVIKHLQR